MASHTIHDQFMVAMEDGSINPKYNNGFEIPSTIAEAVSLSVKLEVGELFRGSPVSQADGCEIDHIAQFFKHEVVLGKRLASGSFADVYEIKTFTLDKSSGHSDTNPKEETVRNALISSARNLIQGPSGGTSEYLDRSVDDTGKFVVKHLRYKLVKDFDVYKRAAIDLAREAKILSSLQHPNVVSLRGISAHGISGFATGCHDGFFLILNRLNETLEDKIEEWRTKHNRLNLDNEDAMTERLNAMKDMANALAYIHQHKVIHRDLKPENFAINDAGQFQIIDFGFARKLPGEDMESHAYNQTYNLTGCTGSLRYMAPEVAAYEQYNEKADVYSSALLMYEILTLRKVFEGFDPRQMATKVYHNHKRPRFPVLFPGSLDGIRKMIKEAWSFDMSTRPTMKSMHDSLLVHSKSVLVDSDQKDRDSKSRRRFSFSRGTKSVPTA